MIDPREAAARAFYNSAGGSYPVGEPGEPVSVPAAPAPVAAPVVPGVPAASAETEAQPAAARPERVSADDFFGSVPTRGLVQWDEPVGAPADYVLQADAGVLDGSEAGVAALGRLRDGLAAAGAGVTLARELFADAVRAQQDPRFRVSRAQGEAELRQAFGDRYDAKVAAAAALVQRAAQRCPEIVPFLERTGLGNSPEFIRKLAAAAGRRGR